MSKKDPRVDAYIARSADFAKPILVHLRKLVHTACPDVQETMKWSFPHFDYKGMMCSMASFKSHCAFGFWKASLVMDGDASRDARKPKPTPPGRSGSRRRSNGLARAKSGIGST
jgi:hypothetical protein